jgi:hypothetical protein
MAFGLHFRGGGWYDILTAVLAAAYIGGFVMGVEYVLARLHFLSSF